jgi:pyruvate-formate lyase-activating enzyme
MSASPPILLDVNEHSRGSAGMLYVYPVVSRRAGGISIGINLNPNNACNWRCIYCQVPDLKRGGPPPIDLERMATELDILLQDVLEGDFLESRVADAKMRHLVDVAFSGNGEPTAAAEFPDAVGRVVAVLDAHRLRGMLPLRLITNGSLMDRAGVQRGVRTMAEAGGEVWFKVDGISSDARSRINGTRTPTEAVERRLQCCASLCPTWLQSCFFEFDGKEPATKDIDAYVAWVGARAHILRGVHLYGLARPSMQADAPHLGHLTSKWFDGLARRLVAQGLKVQISP